MPLLSPYGPLIDLLGTLFVIWVKCFQDIIFTLHARTWSLMFLMSWTWSSRLRPAPHLPVTTILPETWPCLILATYVHSAWTCGAGCSTFGKLRHGFKIYCIFLGSFSTFVHKEALFIFQLVLYKLGHGVRMPDCMWCAQCSAFQLLKGKRYAMTREKIYIKIIRTENRSLVLGVTQSQVKYC